MRTALWKASNVKLNDGREVYRQHCGAVEVPHFVMSDRKSGY